MGLKKIKRKSLFPAVAWLVLLPAAGFSQDQVTITDFRVTDWFKSVRLTWMATTPPGTEATFQIYRSEKEGGPYTLVQEIKLGDKEFIDVITKTYLFYDKKVEAGRRYYYQLTLRGTDQTFGPFGGLASGAPPGT